MPGDCCLPLSAGGKRKVVVREWMLQDGDVWRGGEDNTMPLTYNLLVRERDGDASFTVDYQVGMTLLTPRLSICPSFFFLFFYQTAR